MHLKDDHGAVCGMLLCGLSFHVYHWSGTNLYLHSVNANLSMRTIEGCCVYQIENRQQSEFSQFNAQTLHTLVILFFEQITQRAHRKTANPIQFVSIRFN